MNCEHLDDFFVTLDEAGKVPVKGLKNLVYINDLPNEILKMIFDYLPIGQRLRARRVCVSWKSLAVSHISKLVIKRSSNCKISYDMLNTFFLKDLDDCCDAICFFASQAGPTLRSICFWLNMDLDYEEIEKETISQVTNTLIENCPNLDYLFFFKCGNLNRSLEKLLNVFGNQLKGFRIEKNMDCDGIISRLNPQCLHGLSFDVEHSHFKTIVEQFPLLTELYFDQKIILIQDFSAIQNLSHLKSLSMKKSICFEEFKILFNCQFVNQLITLRMNCLEMDEEHWPMIKQFTNLQCLQLLIQIPKALKHICCLSLLKVLNLGLCFDILNEFDELCQLDQLSNLKNLVLNFHNDWDCVLPFHKLKPMQSMQSFVLKGNCGYYREVKESLLPGVVHAFPNLSTLSLCDHYLSFETMDIYKHLVGLTRLRKLVIKGNEISHYMYYKEDMCLNTLMSSLNLKVLTINNCCEPYQEENLCRYDFDFVDYNSD